MKRLFDAVVAFVGLLLVAPLFGLIALLIKLDSRGPVFFRQQRVGRHFEPFDILKFRSMVADAPSKGALLTVGHDPRITRIGRVIRKTKLDELPQLVNVLKGDMSFVGPRPEVRKYVDMFRAEYEEVLTVRPGITDLASVKYRDESALLANAASPEDEYLTRILPDKLRLAREYLRRSSVVFDLQLIVTTVLVAVMPQFVATASTTPPLGSENR